MALPNSFFNHAISISKTKVANNHFAIGVGVITILLTVYFHHLLIKGNFAHVRITQSVLKLSRNAPEQFSALLVDAAVF